MAVSKAPIVTVPWRDSAGRFSRFKLVGLIVLLLPGLWLIVEFSSGRWDTPSPYVPLIYHSGLWSTYLLLLSLCVTPARRILGLALLAQVRRMIGLTALAYTLLHLFAWLGLRFFDAAVLWCEATTRPTIWVALAAFAGLTALGATSFDRVMRRMGRAWKRLHRMVYPVAGLAILHFLLSPGSVQGLPFLLAGIYAWLMGWRLLDRYRLGAHAGWLAVLGGLAALFTLVLEPMWLATAQAQQDIGPLTALAGNFDLALWDVFGPPPALLVLTGGLLVAGLRLLLDRRSRPMPGRVNGQA